MLPAVSVVIPAYNGAAFLGESLRSVCTQTLPPAEVIVVDDASTDDTPALVTDFAQTSTVPVRLIRLETNSGGPARPLNVGVAEARGEFVAVQDQDDVFAPNKLRVQAAALAADPELTFVFGYCMPVDGPDQTIQTPEVIAKLLRASEESAGRRKFSSVSMFRVLMRHGNVAMGYPGFLFRRQDWERAGGADEGLRISSDYDFLCRLALRGSAALIPAVLYYRRDHQAGLCKRGTEVYLETVRVKARYLAQRRELLDDPELSRVLREEMQGLAYWTREEGATWEALRYYRLIGRLWGWDGGTLWALAKLLPRQLFGRRTAGQGG